MFTSHFVKKILLPSYVCIQHIIEEIENEWALTEAKDRSTYPEDKTCFNDEKVKQEEDYRRQSLASEEQDRSQTPATPSYPHTPQTPEFNLAQRAAEAAQQGYNLVTGHPQHPQVLQRQNYDSLLANASWYYTPMWLLSY